MEFKNVKYILSDIEGTTTSVKFVYDILFPYFLENMEKLRDLKLTNAEVVSAFEETIELAKEEDEFIVSTEEILAKLKSWSLNDKKITTLKTLQGILWEEGYKFGEIKGHIYEDVPEAFSTWKKQNMQLGIFSSGSVKAQKLIFTYSDFGDLSPFLSNYFDTKTGGKRDSETYSKIAREVNFIPENILFLSDISEELEAAKLAGMQTLQLVRLGTVANWDKSIKSFEEIIII
jgi:enolase-phosphatase E1